MEKSKQIEQWHLIFHGEVQGVGFRDGACRTAQKLFLSGTVKNLSDGTVEAYVQGEKEQIDTFLLLLRENYNITSIRSEKMGQSNTFDSFSILF